MDDNSAAQEGIGEDGDILVAVAQIDPKIGDKIVNIERHLRVMEEAAREKAAVVLFPECSLTGYCFRSLEEALDVAEPVPGPATESLVAACRRLGMHCAAGLLEREGRQIYNAAALIGPEGILATYRKTHLPFLGVDRFVTPGPGPFAVHTTPFGRVCLLICYDLRFPEAARVAALKGAELILHLTNLPPGAEAVADVLVRARAAENYVYVASASRVGVERGVTFIGNSQVADPLGKRIAEASSDREEILYARLIPAITHNKDRINVPGQYELHLFGDRRPELYGPLTDPVA